MYIKFFLVGLAIILIIDSYFYRGFSSLFKDFSRQARLRIRWTYWSFTMFSIGMLLLAVYYYSIITPPPKFARVYLTGFIFIVLIAKITAIAFYLMDDLKKVLLFFFKKNGKTGPSKRIDAISRGTFLKKTGTFLGLLPFASMSYGMLFSAFDYRIRKEKITLPNLPEAFEGFKILQISDIHSGSFISTHAFEKAVSLIQDQNADVVLFTGDLVNEIAEEAEPFIDVFKNINAPFGVFSILGNHDYGDYFYPKGDDENRRKNLEKMKEINQKMGWELLLNENRTIERKGSKIGLIGSENWGKEDRFPKYGDLDLARKNMDQCAVNILMSHDPSHWEAKVLPDHPDIDLTLSGHTHGFQMGVEIPGFRWSPAQYAYEQWAGLYEKNGQYIYVNRGLGFIGYPGRVGILPEISVIELSRNKA